MLNQKKYLIRLAKLFLISLVVFRALALNSSAGTQENKPYYIVQDGGSLWHFEDSFPLDPTLEVDPSTVGPAVTEPEKKLWESLGTAVSPEKMWNGWFAKYIQTDRGSVMCE
jgi:hypothetical protein